MAYPRHWLFVMGGYLNASGTHGEIWQCGIRGIPGVEADYGEEDDVLDNLAPVIASWFTASANVVRSDATLEYIKLNEIAPDGTYAHPVTHQHDYATPPVGPSTPVVPQILTACFSWVTARRRGPGHTGRIYPPIWIGSTPGMYITPADATSYANAGKRLLDAVSAASSVSAGTSFKGLAPRCVSSSGVIETITGVRVGTVIDVQRRRKNALPETYQQVSWP